MSSSQQNNTTSAMALPEGVWQTIFSFSGPKAALNCVHAFSESAKAPADHSGDAAENTSIMWVERQLRASHSATQRAKHLQDGGNSPNNRRAEGRELIWESWEYLSDLRCFDALVRHHHSDDQGSALVRMLFSAPVDVSAQQAIQQTAAAAACYPQFSSEVPMANSASVDRSVVKNGRLHQFSAAASQSSATPPIAAQSESSEVPFHCESEAQHLRRRSSVANKKNPSPPTITRRIEVSAETPTSVPPHAGNASEMRLGLTSASVSLSATPQHQALSVTTSSTQRKRAKKARSFALSELPVKEEMVFEESSTTPRDNMITVARLRVFQPGPAEAHNLPTTAEEREPCFAADEMRISCSPNATSPCRTAGVVTSKVDRYADQDGCCSPSCAHHLSRAGDDTVTVIERPLKAQEDIDPTLDCLFNWTQTATWLEEATTGAHLSIHRLLRGIRGLVRSRLVLDAVVDRKDRQITAAQRTAPVQWQHNIRMRTEALAWLFTLGSRMHLTIPVLADAVSVSDACLWSSATTATSYADMLKMLSTAVVLAGGVHGWSERRLGQTMNYLIDAMEAVGLPRITEEDLVHTERVMAETMDVRPYVVVRNYQHMVQRWIEATADGMPTPAPPASTAVPPVVQASMDDIGVLFGQRTDPPPSTPSASTTPVKKAAAASASASNIPTPAASERRAHRSPVTARVLEGRSKSVLAWASVADFKSHSMKLVNAMEMKLVAPLPSMDAAPPASATPPLRATQALAGGTTDPAMMSGTAFTPAITAEPLLAGITGMVPSESMAAKQSMKRPRSMKSMTRPAATRVCAQHRSEHAEAVLQRQAIETARAQCDELIHYTEAVVLSSPQTLFAHMLNLMPREVADAHASLAVRLMIQLMHDFPLYQYVCPAVQALACIRILLDVDAACPAAAANSSTPRLGPNEMFLHVVGLLDLCGFDMHAHDVMSTVLSVAAALRARCCPEPSTNAQPDARVAVDVPMM